MDVVAEGVDGNGIPFSVLVSEHLVVTTRTTNGLGSNEVLVNDMFGTIEDFHVWDCNEDGADDLVIVLTGNGGTFLRFQNYGPGRTVLFATNAEILRDGTGERDSDFSVSSAEEPVDAAAFCAAQKPS